MIIAAISANIFTSAVGMTAPHAVTSNTRAFVEIVAQTNKMEATTPSSTMEESSPVRKVEAVNVDHWDAEKNLRFKELARKEALGEPSIEELAELESLTRLRRYEKYPRSAYEILWQRQQERITRNLVQALQTYVEFHEASYHSQT